MFSELNRELITISEDHTPSRQQSALRECVVILGTFTCFAVTSSVAVPQHLLVITPSHCPIFPFILASGYYSFLFNYMLIIYMTFKETRVSIVYWCITYNPNLSALTHWPFLCSQFCGSVTLAGLTSAHTERWLSALCLHY